MKDALFEAANEGHNGYSPSEGYLELRTGIVEREQKRNNVTYTPDDLCITTGVTESLQILLNASLDPGDELLIPGPTYPQYTLITRFNNAVPVAYRCIEEEGWQPDVDISKIEEVETPDGVVFVVSITKDPDEVYVTEGAVLVRKGAMEYREWVDTTVTVLHPARVGVQKERRIPFEQLNERQKKRSIF